MAEQFMIAIDGPAGAGKSTVARKVASTLSLRYIDTGAMYRAVTYAALVEHISVDEGERLSKLVDMLKIRILPDAIHYYFKNKDITEKLRSSQVNQFVSTVSKHFEVRQALAKLQRQIAKQSEIGVVMDGRDIGTVVLPDADLKIFLTACIDVRTQRRLLEVCARGQEASFDEIKASILHRDALDQSRHHAPLTQAEDAVLIDTSDKSVAEVVAIIVARAQAQRAVGGGKDVL